MAAERSNTRAGTGPDLATVRPDLADRLAGLTPAQRALLGRRLRARGPSGPFPLTPTQFGIWLFEQLNPGTSTYHNPAAVRLSGPVDEDALRAALQRIQDRHEPLRSRYPEDEDGVPQALVEPPGALRLPWRVEDVGGDADPQRSADALLRAEAVRPFPLDRGPVWRCLLVRTGPEERLLVTVFHHIVSDGGSLGILLGELARLYPALLAGRDDPLPPLARGYFAVTQRLGRDFPAELEHWQHTLAGAPDRIDLDALTGLPDTHAAASPPGAAGGPGPDTSRGSAATHSWHGHELAVTVPEPLTAALERRCARQGTTLFAALVTAFAATLHRATGQSDLVLTTPVDGRGGDGRDLIGCFVNTVALRLQVAPTDTLRTLLDRTAAAVSDALGHSDLPFARLVAALPHRRADAQRPFGNVAVVHNNAPLDGLSIGGLRLRHHPLPPVEVKHDLALSWARTGGGLSGRIEFAEHLAAAAIDQLAIHVRDTVDTLAHAPDTPVTSLPAVLAGRGER